MIMDTPFIYEVPVYDGAKKVWRVLNVNSGTIYSKEFETAEEAYDSINDGEKRGEQQVIATSLPKIIACVDYFEENASSQE